MNGRFKLSCRGAFFPFALVVSQACGGAGQLEVIGEEKSAEPPIEILAAGGSNSTNLEPGATEPELPILLEPELNSEAEPEPDPPYVEAGCPDQPPVVPNYQCEPFGTTNTCGPGFGCIPYLVYSDEGPCAQANYGSFCGTVGAAVQGESCGSFSQCSAGFLCVVGALAGSRCGQICVPGANGACDPGLICGETDVPGVGVCF